MADRHIDHVLIGGGLASANCARHLRENSDDSILLVGREPEPPYNRPALTKGYLAHTEERSMDYFRPSEFWDEQKIELMTRMNVMKLDTEAHEVTLMNKQVISYGKALVATGANVNLLHVDGMGQEGIHYLRAFGNSDSILEDLGKLGRRVTLIGGSYIGCEVAATLSRHGCECNIVMLEDLPLQRTLGDELGRWTQGQLEALGIVLHPGQGLQRLDGDGERVTSVVCDSGLEIETDVVVIGAGVHPDTMLAKQAGLEIGERGGIVTDSQLRTSAPDVFAAGDVAEWFSPFHQQHIRVEHWDVAFNHGRTAALNMLGREHVHDVVPYFWTDIADVEIESVGPAYGWDRTIVRGRPEDSAFSVWYLQGARVAQVAAVGRSQDIETGRGLIAAHKELSASELEAIANPEEDLAKLLA
jgi:3-phenylpropionate/trans-cinnamate dioxygenase ferredoxin reductase subunit